MWSTSASKDSFEKWSSLKEAAKILQNSEATATHDPALETVMALALLVMYLTPLVTLCYLLYKLGKCCCCGSNTGRSRQVRSTAYLTPTDFGSTSTVRTPRVIVVQS